MNRIQWECVLDSRGYKTTNQSMTPGKSSVCHSEHTWMSRSMHPHSCFQNALDSLSNKKLSISKINRKASPIKRPEVSFKKDDPNQFLASKCSSQTRTSELIGERCQEERKVVDTAQIFQLINQFKCKYSALQKKYSKQERPRVYDTTFPLRKVQTMAERSRQIYGKQKSGLLEDQSNISQLSTSCIITKKVLPGNKNTIGLMQKQSNLARTDRKAQKSKSFITSIGRKPIITPTIKSSTPHVLLFPANQISRNSPPCEEPISKRFQVIPKRPKSKPYRVALSQDEYTSDDDDDKESIVVHRFQISSPVLPTNPQDKSLSQSSLSLKQSLCSSNLPVKPLVSNNLKNLFRKPGCIGN